MTGTMTAVVKTAPAPGSEVRQVPVPRLGLRDVLIKVKAASICGTDLHIQDWDKWAQGRIQPAAGLRPRVLRRGRRARRGRDRGGPRHLRVRRGARRGRHLLPVPDRQRPHLRERGHRRRRSPRLLRGVRGGARDQRLRDGPRHLARGRRHPGSLRQRGAHHALRRGRRPHGGGGGLGAHRVLRGRGGPRRRARRPSLPPTSAPSASTSRGAWGRTASSTARRRTRSRW